MRRAAPLSKHVERFVSERPEEANPGLLFFRFVPSDLERERGRKFLEEVIKAANSEQTRKFLELWMERLRSLPEKLEEGGYRSKLVEGIAKERIFIGLGGAHPLESSFSLHPLYGFPYLPSSSIKGLVGEEEICGTQKGKGEVIFFDAFPKPNRELLQYDIISVHYKSYYDSRGRKPPAGLEGPTIINLLCIPRGTSFLFLLASKDEEKLKKGIELLQERLELLGIGARTKLGFGRIELRVEEAEKAEILREKISRDPGKLKVLKDAIEEPKLFWFVVYSEFRNDPEFLGLLREAGFERIKGIVECL